MGTNSIFTGALSFRFTTSSTTAREKYWWLVDLTGWSTCSDTCTVIYICIDIIIEILLTHKSTIHCTAHPATRHKINKAILRQVRRRTPSTSLECQQFKSSTPVSPPRISTRSRMTSSEYIKRCYNHIHIESHTAQIYKSNLLSHRIKEEKKKTSISYFHISTHKLLHKAIFRVVSKTKNQILNTIMLSFTFSKFVSFISTI